MANDTIKFKIGQVLQDKNSKGKERPWRKHKYHSIILSKSFRRIWRANYSAFRRRKGTINYSRRADNAEMCGTSLNFTVENGKLRLAHAKFCQISLCPLCGWRKSLNISRTVSLVTAALQDEGYRLIMATFTVKNVSAQDLKAQLAELTKAFKYMTNYKQFKTSIMGYFRALEITHDTERYITYSMYQNSKAYYDKMGLSAGDKNPNFDKYHPHFHVLLAVNKSYFNDPDYYISQADFAKMWQRALKASYTPVVDVRAIKGSRKDINEVAKYTTKSGDYLIGERDDITRMLITVDEPLTDSAVEVLSEALHKRRLVGWGGVFDEKRKELGLEEEVKAEVDTDGEQPVKLHFRWFNVGFNNYKLTQIFKDGENLDEVEIEQKNRRNRGLGRIII